jgi:hypothetical protein
MGEGAVFGQHIKKTELMARMEIPPPGTDGKSPKSTSRFASPL